MAKKQSKPKEEHQSAPLVAALKFINIAQNTTGAPWTWHAILYDGMAYGSNGILSAGHPIAEHLQVAPHTAKLVAALERCTEHMAMIELPSGLSVKSDRFKAVVPCHVLRDMPPVFADPPIAPLLDGPLRAAFAAVGPLATEGAPRVMCAAVRLGPGSACATNSHVLVEYWHGLDLPEMLIPKASVRAIEFVKKKLTQFGYSGRSATFYYEDGSWIKTQLYNETYPDIARVLNKPSNPWPIPPGLFDALRQIKPFVGEHNAVIFAPKMLRTHGSDVEGATVELDGVPGEHAFNIDYLLGLEGLAKTIDFGDDDVPLQFFGDNVRGAVSAIRYTSAAEVTYVAKPAPVTIQPRTAAFNDMDDDIPF